MTHAAPTFESLRPMLSAGLASLPFIPATQLDGLASRLLDYVALLQRWNATYNLTAIRDPEQMVSRHLLDSLAIAPYVEGPLADIGSGAGLPGIPLALAQPQLQVTLVESSGKKARFLREAIRVLRLDNARVAHERAEALEEDGRYACVVSRAFSSLADFIRVGAHLLKTDGRLLAMKGMLPTEEIAALPPGWRLSATHALLVPGLAEQRHLLELARSPGMQEQTP
jgi:16S rRNA (guanine527-N7)-methyltransferase